MSHTKSKSTAADRARSARQSPAHQARIRLASDGVLASYVRDLALHAARPRPADERRSPRRLSPSAA
jgi:hypothetical protein